MKLTNFSVERPVTTMMFMLALVILGAISLSKLTLDLYPKLNFPIAVVATSYEGAAPKEVENLVTRPMEEVMGTVPGVKNIQSNSAPGASQVIVEFEFGTDMDFATLDMREKVDLIREALPDGANDPRVLKLDPNSMPIMWLALGGEDVVEMKRLAEEDIQPALEKINGVASVNIVGGKTREVQVQVDPIRLQAHGLSVGQVVQAIQGENIAASAGAIRKGQQDLLLRVDNEFDSVDEIEEILIPLPRGGHVKVSDVAEVEDTFKEVTQLSYLDGNPSVTLEILKQTDANTVEVSNQVKEALEDVKQKLPEGVAIKEVFDQAKFINDSIYNMRNNMLIGAVFSVLVLYAFLGSVRSTMVISLAMPIAIIGAFTMLYFADQTLNILTLGGLALGIGMMVDSAIVVLESIFRYRQQGYSMLEAAKQGTEEVGTAVIAASLTTVAVFMPIVFVEGIAAMFFKPMALAVSFSLIASLIVAITLVPMLSSKLLHKVEAGEEGMVKMQNIVARSLTRLNHHYGKLLNWALGHRKTIVFGTIGLLILSLALVPLIGAEFTPEMDQGIIIVDVELPTGSQLEETEEVVSRIEQMALQIPEVQLISSNVGSPGGFSFDQVATTEFAQMFIRLTPVSERDRSIYDIVAQLREGVKDIPGADITVDNLDNSGGPPNAPLEVSIQGDDLDTLKELGDIVAEEVRKVPGAVEVETSFGDGRPEMNLTVDRETAAFYGINTSQVISTVRAAFDGQLSTRMKTGDTEVDVTVILPENYRENIQNLKELMIASPTGALIPITQIAEFHEELGPDMIKRRNQSREVLVSGDIQGRDLNSVITDIKERLKGISIPDGYTIDYGGLSKEMAESFSSLTLALVLAIVLVYMIMASQFESLLYPFIIMFSLPPTLIGVIVGLALTGRALSVPAFIGMIILAGVVVNNAIVLVDYINTLRKQGMSRDEAIKKAGPVRLRPILMTALTTILALIPMTLGIGEGSEAQAPLATVVVFGLSFSTLITLVLVPVIYTILDDLGQKTRRFFRRILSGKSGKNVGKEQTV
ncbi:MAG: efflux RND transporter permease subunit [Bacillaceae bacterium]|nr:efflux RND transporter permease subunit [Bacillaceae bacterium]